jgi:transposase
VISLESWQTIRHLASLGKSQRFIAETLGISRDAVARAIKQEEHADYQREPSVQQMLGGFQPVVEQGLARGLSGKRLFDAVRQSGYSGSQATFYRWLAGVQQERATSNGACRFETGPAEQAQFDWSPYLLEIGGSIQRVIIYSVILGYSRRIHFYPSLSEKQDSVIEGLEVGLRHFGGSCRFVLIDNAKAMVLQHRHRQLVWNPCFLAFCGHYRVQPIASTPVHPQTKGKVENPFRHLESGLLTGASWRDWRHLGEDLQDYELRREQRVHGTTRQTPAQRFEQERESLVALPARPFLGCLQNVRQLNNDGLFSFRGTRYCVPASPGLRDVRVRTRQGRELLVFDAAGKEIICHTIAPDHSPPVIVPECYEHLKARRRLSLATQMTLIRHRFPESPIVEEFLSCLLERHAHHPEDTLSGVLQLLEAVPDGSALSVLAEAVSLRLPDPATLSQLLARPPRELASTGIALAPIPLNRPLARSCVETLPALDVERPLSDYAALLPTTESIEMSAKSTPVNTSDPERTIPHDTENDRQ